MALTDEDKQWFTQQLERFGTKDDMGRFASKEDLERFATKEQLEALETRLLTEMHRVDESNRQWTLEQLERLETRLLTEFHRWASPFEARQRSHSAALRAFDAELELLLDRIRRLEEGQTAGD
jgi:hypothetical protein